MPGLRTWIKAGSAGLVLVIGGPALVRYVSPTEEEIFERYSPELKKKALETRYQRQKEFDDFVCHLKEASKSDKPIWTRLKEMEIEKSERDAQTARDAQAALAAGEEKRKAEIRNSTK